MTTTSSVRTEGDRVIVERDGEKREEVELEPGELRSAWNLILAKDEKDATAWSIYPHDNAHLIQVDLVYNSRGPTFHGWFLDDLEEAKALELDPVVENRERKRDQSAPLAP